MEITISRIEAAYKLSQNRDEKNHANIVSELENRGDENSVEIANQMRKYGVEKKQWNLVYLSSTALLSSGEELEPACGRQGEV